MAQLETRRPVTHAELSVWKSAVHETEGTTLSTQPFGNGNNEVIVFVNYTKPEQLTGLLSAAARADKQRTEVHAGNNKSSSFSVQGDSNN